MPEADPILQALRKSIDLGVCAAVTSVVAPAYCCLH